MKFRVEVICVNDEGAEQRRDVMEMKRDELVMETLGLSLAEGKALLLGVQASWPHNKSARISSGVAFAPTAVSGTTAKQRGRARWRRYSGPSRCLIRGGSGAPVKPKAPKPFGPRRRG